MSSSPHFPNQSNQQSIPLFLHSINDHIGNFPSNSYLNHISSLKSSTTESEEDEWLEFPIPHQPINMHDV